MSGICGIVFNDRNRQLTLHNLLPMVQALNYSGFDEGFTESLGPVGIGAQRFHGRQAGVAKLTLHEQSLGLAFHGNLFKLKELFPLITEKTNYTIKLLELYLKEGMTFLHRLRGEFAIALWDGREETLHLATDRFRVHPIFYYMDQEKLVFASRIKAILACPLPIDRTIDPQAVVDSVATSIIPTPKTIYKAVKKQPPGHLLTYKKGKINTEPYWKVSFLHPSYKSESVLAKEFKTCLAEAVDIRLKFDGNPDRIGSFLSGGVDSSTITGVLTQLAGQPVKTISIGFDEERFNEIHYARIAARAFGARQYEYFVTPRDTYNTIQTLVEAIDEPYGNASAISIYFCAKTAREHGVDILYAGDGGDELFAGNKRYADEKLFEYYTKFPKWTRESLIKPLVFSLADKSQWKPFNLGKKYILRASIPYPERITSYDFFNVVPMADFIEDDLKDAIGRDYNPYAPFIDYYLEAPALNSLDRHLYMDWKLTVSDNDLLKFRMAEVAGVPIRFPFLDSKLAEFSTKVPYHMKMRGLKLRTFQKKAFSDLLPLEVRKKKKHGFGLPIPIWLKTDNHLNELMHELVLSPQTIQRGYFKKKAIENLVESHKSDDTSFYGTALWNLMVMELWHRNYGS